MARRISSHSLGEFPLDVARIECQRCDRAGSYRRDGLMARFGADIALPDLLLTLAECERPAGLLEALWRAVHGPGGARPVKEPPGGSSVGAS